MHVSQICLCLQIAYTHTHTHTLSLCVWFDSIWCACASVYRSAILYVCFHQFWYRSLASPSLQTRRCYGCCAFTSSLPVIYLSLFSSISLCVVVHFAIYFIFVQSSLSLLGNCMRMQNTVSDYPEMVFRVKEHENVTASNVARMLCSRWETEPVYWCTFIKGMTRLLHRVQIVTYTIPTGIPQ